MAFIAKELCKCNKTNPFCYIILLHILNNIPIFAAPHSASQFFILPMKQIYRLISLILLQMCYLGYAYAQVNMLFTSDNDLPNSLINKIVEDQDGMVWIATEDGLCKYNGSHFVAYYHEDGNPNSLVSNFVRTLAVDKENHIFVGTIQGVQMYRPATDDFTSPVGNPEQDIYPSNVTDLSLLSTGETVVSGHTTFVVNVNALGEIEASNMLFSQKLGNSYQCAEDAKGSLWILKQNEDVYHITRQGNLSCIRDASNRRYILTAICLGPDDKMYAGSSSGDLLRFNEESQLFDTLTSTNQKYFIRDLQALPSSPFLCIGTDGQGMKFLHCPSGQISDFLFNYPFINPAVQKVHTIAVSSNRDIWMGLYQKGVMLTTRTPAQFHYMGIKSGSNNYIGDHCVSTLLQTHDGNVWVGTDNGGLHGITPQGELVANHWGNGTTHSIPSAFVTLFEDSRQRVWFGTFHQGFGWVDLTTGKCRYLPIQGRDASTINVYAFAEDRRGTIWVATMGSGVMRFNERTQSLEPITGSRGASNWSCDIVYNDNDDKLYVGTYTGLCIFDLQSNEFARETLLDQHVVNDLCLYAPNQLCLCTNQGFVLFNCVTKEIQEFTKKDGLPSTTIYAAEADDEGDLWLSSSNGLIKYNVARNTFNNYTVQDGLQGNEFYKKASMRDNKGMLWFGGINGITWFDPRNIVIQSQQCEVRVVSLHSDQQAFLPDSEGNYHLGVDEHAFSVELATRPLSYTRRVIYKSSLDGIHWQSLPPLTNLINFSNVAAGTHTLYFKAVCDGIDSEIFTMRVHIAQPWFRLWWARTIWISVLLLLCYLTYLQIRRRRIIRQHLQQHQQAQAINEAKLQFFMNIAHDFRTPMTLIVNPLQKLLQSDNNSAHKHDYELMLRNANRILNLINELMDLRKIDKEQMRLTCRPIAFNSYILDLCSSMNDLAEGRQVKLLLDGHLPTGIRCWIDTNCFDKILLNLLSNAFKYTPEGGCITVSWSLNEAEPTPHKCVIIKVSDTGIGIPDEEKGHIFERFYQVRRATGQNFGTGIGLHLVHALVNLHHGTITVCDNSTGQGTTFILTLPIEEQAYSQEERLLDEATTERTDPVVKPLTDATVSLLSASETETTAPRKMPKNGHSILLVDDDDEIRHYLEEELQTRYHILACKNGEEALRQLTLHKFDLMITDVMMPGMNGIELCTQVRRNINLNELSIIMLTAKSTDEDRITSLNLGVDTYMTKPFNIEVLKSTVQNLLKQHDRLRKTLSGHAQQADNVATPKVTTNDERLLKRVTRVVEEHLKDTALNSDMIASEVGLSRVHLFRKLKELTGQTTREFYRNVRLTKAAELLADKKLTVSEVAVQVGFSNQHNFSKAFKEMYGMPPAEYIQLHQQQQSEKENVTK